MTPTQKHTPTPWHTFQIGDEVQINNDLGATVAVVKPHNTFDAMSAAALIVQAVNAYDRLLAERESNQETIRELVEAAKSALFEGEGQFSSETTKLLKAAISKAEGRQ